MATFGGAHIAGLVDCRRVCDAEPVIEPVPKPLPPLQEVADAATSLFIFADVLEELRFNATWRSDRIGGGLLVGRRYLDPESRRPYTEVEGFLAGTHVVDVGEFSRYLRVQWKAATAGLRFHFPESEIIGWYLAVSADDRTPGVEEVALHETFFTHPWQRALWVPGRGRATVLNIAGGTFTVEPMGIAASQSGPPTAWSEDPARAH